MLLKELIKRKELKSLLNSLTWNVKLKIYQIFNKFMKDVKQQIKDPYFDPYSILRCKFREMNIF